MPTYMYKCNNGHTFEKSVSIEQRNMSQVCPYCDAPAHRDFLATVQTQILFVPVRHRADREIEITRIVVGETEKEREQFKRKVASGQLVREPADMEKRLGDVDTEDTERRITKELWDEAKRLTHGGRELPKEMLQRPELPPDLTPNLRDALNR